MSVYIDIKVQSVSVRTETSQWVNSDRICMGTDYLEGGGIAS